MTAEPIDHPSAPPAQSGWLSSLKVYGERRSLVMLALGFAAGLPNLLIFDTLTLWLREEGVSLQVIAFFGLATLTYALKFFWAPLVDRTAVPGLTRILGHRRSWMLVTQLMIIFGLWSMAGLNPASALGSVALFAVLVGVFGATQDIVIDAWRIEAADDSRQGAMAAAYQWGYRVAAIVAGAAPLLLAEIYNWNISYAVMAALMGVGVAGVLLAPREKAHTVRPIPVGDTPRRPAQDTIEWVLRLALIAVAFLIAGTGMTGKPQLAQGVMTALGFSAAGAQAFADTFTDKTVGAVLQVGAALFGLALLVVACWPLPGRRTRPGAYMAGSFGAPMADFYRRFSGTATLILALICLYRLADFVLNLMNPFYADLGFTKVEIAEVRKVFGVVASLAGVFLGGWSVAKLGLIRTMVIGAFASPLSNLVFAWLATQGPELSALFIAIGVDNVATGYAGTALIAYMSSLTSAGFTATQYALFSSLYALPGKLIASQSGRIVEASARAAEGGPFTPLRALFSRLPATSFAEGAATAAVTPAGLAAGYVVFFLYSTLLGGAAIALAFVVAARSRRERRAASATAMPVAG